MITIKDGFWICPNDETTIPVIEAPSGCPCCGFPYVEFVNKGGLSFMVDIVFCISISATSFLNSYTKLIKLIDSMLLHYGSAMRNVPICRVKIITFGDTYLNSDVIETIFYDYYKQ
jgi:hypothetical protein